MAKRTKGLNQGLGLVQADRSFSNSPASSLLSLGLGVFGLLIRETGLVLRTLPRPHSVVPVFITMHKSAHHDKLAAMEPAGISFLEENAVVFHWHG